MLIKLSGYSRDLELRNRFTYIINTVSIFLVLFFFTFYIAVVKEIIINIVTTLCLIDLLSVYIFLKKEKYFIGKIVLLFGFLFQEFSLIFLWFPPEANFNYFLFIVAPIAFFIFDFDIIRERIAIILTNILAVSMLVLSELLTVASVVEISPALAKLFTILSAGSTIGSTLIVFYSYARNLSSIHKKLNLLAHTDVLTKAYNRRTLYKEGKTLFALAGKYNKGFGFLIFDIDFFKNINDEFGHPAGDSILVRITELILENVRTNDIVARYGGEEFGILLLDSTEKGNIHAAEHLRTIVEEYKFPIEENREAKLTISIGVVHYSKEYDSFDQMLQHADKALYKAKNGGRNKVVAG